MFSRVGLTTLGRRVLCDLETPSQGPVVQLVRWRKRRWAPINASKIYYVREPTPEDPAEKAELLHRYRNYKTTIKALTAYFKEEVALKEAGKSSKLLTDREDAEWAELLHINDEWNSTTAQIRDVRQTEEELRIEELRLADLAAIEEQKLAKLLDAQRLVQEEIVQAKHFIDPNNLDLEIEKALNMRVSYNYAIDKDGNRYIERQDGSTAAETKEAETIQRFEQKKDGAERLEN